MCHPRPSRWLTPILLGAIVAAGAASPTPARAAATQAAPAIKADYSSPVAATGTLLTALHEGDFATARAALIIPEDQKPAMDAFLDAMAATARLQQAAAAKYPAAAAAQFPPPTPEALAAKLKRVAAGDLTVNGDTATLIVATDTTTNATTKPTTQPTTQTLALRKIGAAWKVDGPSFFNLTAESADETAARIALAGKLTAIADAVAADITAGKFFSAADAYQEYWSRCLQVVSPAAAAATSATASGTASAAVTTTKP